MNKPEKPNIIIPESFAENGVKTDFDSNKLLNGFDRIQPDVLAGDNLNKFIDDTYKGLNYGIKGVDYLEERWKSQITSCLLEVPQRIKLELTDGVLTLKAGSEVIVPNGFEDDGVTPKFDYVKIEEDKICEGFQPGKCSIIINQNNDLYSTTIEQHHASGAEEPSGFIGIFYNTGINKVGYRTDATQSFTYGYALPLGWATNISTTECSSIDQVFNGMGYIGSTVWVDKGVKGLASKGTNNDGSYKNFEYINNNFIVRDISNLADDGIFFINLDENGNFSSTTACANTRYLEGLLKNRPTTLSNTYFWLYYATDENMYYFTSGSTTPNWKRIYLLPIAKEQWDNSNITSFIPKQPFRAVDYSDKSWVAQQSFPSNRVYSYPVGASGAGYIAQGTGEIYAKSRSTSTPAWLQIGSNGHKRMDICWVAAQNNVAVVSLEVTKGEQFFVSAYNMNIESIELSYAQGEV